MHTLLASLTALLSLASPPGKGEATAPPRAQGQRQISGPYAHRNLTVFLVHGPDTFQGATPLTLEEAIAGKKVLVHETGSVGELLIENVSGQEVFVQAGDIVKGGRQDRTLSVTTIIPPRSGKLPVESFCVEQGRWSKRDGESDQRFNGSKNRLSSKALKLAAVERKDQGMVWQSVAEAQAKLEKNLKAEVKGRSSDTSLQLTLESGAVRAQAEDYVRALIPIINGKPDVIGYVFAIHGEVNSAELYGSHALFAKLWPKLLASNAVEALAELDRGDAAKPLSRDEAEAFLAPSSGRSGKSSKVFETRAPAHNGALIHTSLY